MKDNLEKNEVFISYKNTVRDSEQSVRTSDAEMARELYEGLEKAGIHTFFAEETLRRQGRGEYKEIINCALDECSVLIVVGTSVENITSKWVKYEWDSFSTDILNGLKIGEIFSYVDNIHPHTLPRSLREWQCFERRSTPLENIVEYIRNALRAVKRQQDGGVCSSETQTYSRPVIEQEESRCRKADMCVEVKADAGIEVKADANITVKADADPDVDAKMDTDANVNENVDKLLQFASLISSVDSSGNFVNPYISAEMADLVAKHIGVVEEYNAERCMEAGINPVVYEVFLAQKIARRNQPENCANSFLLLHQVINCWRVFLNEERKVVSYWTFIALREESYNRIKTGQVDEKDISIENVRFIDMPGRYKGYLLLSGTIEECRTPRVVKLLYSSWLTYLQTLAEEGIFFDEISSMVGSAAGNSSLQNIGMKYYADYISGGKMYRYFLKNVDQIPYLTKHYPRMAQLYHEEYEGENDEV